MIRWRDGTVTGLRRRWHGAVELDVTVAGRTVPALAYPALVGEPEPGDRVLLNVGALELGLGTGGYAMVVALPDRLPPDPPGPASRADGHAVKARYTPLQAVTLSVDEPASPHHALLSTVEDVGGMPVVTADLHSALPAIVAGVRADAPGARVAYVMTDGAALPAWFSRTLDGLAGHLAGVVTVGQAFGGDLEAATVHSGLLAARHVLRADIAVVTQGPGNLGTGTPWGFSGVAAGEAVNAAAVLGGRPVGSLRISAVDPRPRHRGVSHHSLTAYGQVALARADLVIPAGLPDRLAADVDAALAPLARRHRLVRVPTDGLDAALRALPVKLSTMGRDLDADHAYFLAAAAAGRHAVALS
ncbi:MAG: DUF3866 family protein [Actinobacteria bacterium]|nr:MAG: DUF3866 family protein [Actinomycetota bacterium]